MATKYYDAIIIGSNLAGRLLAGILSARHYSVLVVRRWQREGAPRLSWPTTASSPVFPDILDLPLPTSIVREMKIGHRLRSSLNYLPVTCQIVEGGRRTALMGDPDEFLDELSRSFRDEHHREDTTRLLDLLAEASQPFDRFLAAENPLFPMGFLERRRYAKFCAELKQSLSEQQERFAELDKLRTDTCFGSLIVPSRGELELSSTDPDNPCVYRKLANSLARVFYPNDKEDFGEIVESRLKNKGCEILDDFTIRSFHRKRGVFVLEGENKQYSGQNFIFASDPFLLPLLSETSKLARFYRKRCKSVAPEAVWVRQGYWLDKSAIPEGMDLRVMRLDEENGAPFVFLRDPRLHANSDRERIELCCPIPVADFDAAGLERIQATMRNQFDFLFPFAEPHLKQIDDDRIPKEWAVPLEDDPTDGMGKLAGRKVIYRNFNDHRTVPDGAPICLPWDHGYIVGPDNLPDLGLEGEFAAAWATARVIGNRTPKAKIIRK